MSRFVGKPGQSVRAFWNNIFQRLPLQLSQVVPVHSIEDCELAVSRLREPCLGATIACIGVDAEFVNNCIPYAQWPSFEKRFKSNSIKSDSKGPFARVLQLADAKGTVYLVDLHQFTTFPAALLDLFGDENVMKCGHDLAQDFGALCRTFAECSSLVKRSILDTRSRYLELQREKLLSRFSRLMSTSSGSLDSLVDLGFGLTLAKEDRGIRLFWNVPFSQFTDSMINYAARDALASVDIAFLWAFNSAWEALPRVIDGLAPLRIQWEVEFPPKVRPVSSPLVVSAAMVAGPSSATTVSGCPSVAVTVSGHATLQKVQSIVSGTPLALATPTPAMPPAPQPTPVVVPASVGPVPAKQALPWVKVPSNLYKRVRSDVSSFRKSWQKTYARSTPWNVFADDYLRGRQLSYESSCSANSVDMVELLRRKMVLVIGSHSMRRRQALMSKGRAMLGREPATMSEAMRAIDPQAARLPNRQKYGRLNRALQSWRVQRPGQAQGVFQHPQPIINNDQPGPSHRRSPPRHYSSGHSASRHHLSHHSSSHRSHNTHSSSHRHSSSRHHDRH